MNMHKRVVVYTVILNSYDTVKTPRHIVPEYDYFCITDDLNFTDPVWKPMQIQNIDFPSSDKAKLARSAKILTHKYFPDYDYSLFIDGSIEIIGNIKEIIDTNKLLVVNKHPNRTCLYEEAEACKSFLKDTAAVIDNQVKQYRTHHYPENNGLIESGVLMRQHNHPTVMSFMSDWFYQIRLYSKRDQISFGYIAEKYKDRLVPEIWTTSRSNLFVKYFQIYRHQRYGA